MVNLKNYDKTEDFNHHRIEFENAYEIIQRHTSLEGKIILDLCSGTGMHSGFLLQRIQICLWCRSLDYEYYGGGLSKIC